MAIEFLLVTYPEQRAVLADGNRVGFTNHTLMLPTDEYLIALEGGGYTPPSQDVPLAGTSLVKPMVISFAPISSTGGGPSAPAAAAPAPAARPAGKKKKNA
jgi:PEGA domain